MLSTFFIISSLYEKVSILFIIKSGTAVSGPDVATDCRYIASSLEASAKTGRRNIQLYDC